jgi:hypothetical protein
MPAHRWWLFQAVTVVANRREGQQGGASWLWGTARRHWPTQSSARPRICVPAGLAAACRLDDGTMCGQTVQFVGGARAGLSCGDRIVLCYPRRTILHHTELSCDAMPDCCDATSDCLAMKMDLSYTTRVHTCACYRFWIWVWAWAWLSLKGGGCSEARLSSKQESSIG